MNSSNQTESVVKDEEVYLGLEGNILNVVRSLPLIIVVVGTIANTLTLITVTSPKTKKSSFTVYLAALAVVDTVVLYMWALDYWIQAVFNLRIEDTSNFMCKTRMLANLTCQQISAWLIVALTLERTFCTYFPLRLKIVCRPRVGYIVVAVISTVILASCSHMLYGFSLEQNRRVCKFVSVSYARVFREIVSWIVVATYFFIPGIIIIIGNIATVLKVYRSGLSVSSELGEPAKKRVRNILIVTLLLSASFILLVGPFSTWIVVRAFVFPSPNFTQKATSRVEQIAQISTHTLIHIYHACNFFLYVLSGERFRQDLKAAFSRCLAGGKRTPSTTSRMSRSKVSENA